MCKRNSNTGSYRFNYCHRDIIPTATVLVLTLINNVNNLFRCSWINIYIDASILSGKNVLKFTWGGGGSIFASNFGPIVTKNSLNLLLISSTLFISLFSYLKESGKDESACLLFIASFIVFQVSFKLPFAYSNLFSKWFFSAFLLSVVNKSLYTQ